MSRKGIFATVISIGLAIALVSFTRWRNKKEKSKRLKNKKEGSINIGGIFGMDVGGTLTKIVYFEAKLSNHNNQPQEKLESSCTEEIPRTPVPKPPPLLRSNSMGNLIDPGHQEALHKLYTNLSLFDKHVSGDPSSTYLRDERLSFYSSVLEGRIHFLHFETRNMINAIKLLEDSGVTEHIRTIGCTGGGAMKYSRMFEEELNIKFHQLDELGSLIKGMNFALANVKDECYTYRVGTDDATSSTATDSGTSSSSASAAINANNPTASTPTKSSSANARAASAPSSSSPPSGSASTTSWKQRNAKDYTKREYISHEAFTRDHLFPYLVVNIGSGVSILKVSSADKFERVSGSSLGGGTYWGLCRLLTRCTSYSEVLDLAEVGDSTNVDMLVRDIYGGGYDGMNLSGTMVASSFGKLVMKENPRDGIREEDLALTLLMMITNNIGQIAFLNARLHNCRKIFFVGSFLRENDISCKRLSYSIDFWSKGEMEALFLTHEGYFGALGTFLVEAFGENVDKVLAVSLQQQQEEAEEEYETEDRRNSPVRSNSGSRSSGGDGSGVGSSGVTGTSSSSGIGGSGIGCSSSGSALSYAVKRSRPTSTTENNTWRNWRPLSFTAFMRTKQKDKESATAATPRVATDANAANAALVEPAAVAAAVAASIEASTAVISPTVASSSVPISPMASGMTTSVSHNRSRASTESSLSSQPETHYKPFASASTISPVGSSYSSSSAVSVATRQPSREDRLDPLENDSVSVSTAEREEYLQWQQELQLRLAGLGGSHSNNNSSSNSSTGNNAGSNNIDSNVSLGGKATTDAHSVSNKKHRTMSENYTSLIELDVVEETEAGQI